MRIGALVLLAGCFRPVHVHADGASPDDMPDVSDALADGPADGPVDGVPLDAVPTMLVQQGMAGSGSAGSISVTLPVPPATNHMLLAIGGCANGANAPTGAASWQLVAQSVHSPTEYVYIGTPSSGATVTLTTANPGAMFLVISEWNGIDPTSPVSTGNGTNAGTSGAIDLSIITSSAPDLVVFTTSSYGTVAPPAGTWTGLLGATAGSVTQKSWYQLAWAPGTLHAQTNYSNDYDAVLAAFRTIP